MIDEEVDTRAPIDASMARRAWPLLRPDLAFYVIAGVCAPISAALSIAQPWLLKRAIDDHLVPGDIDGLAAAAWAYLALVVASFVAESAYTLAIATASLRTITRTRGALYAHTLRLAPSYWDQRPTGRVLTRVTSDVEALGEVLTAGAVTIVLDALLVVAILGAMAWLDATLTVVTLVLAPPIAWIVNRIRSVLKGLFDASRASVSVLNAFTAERLAGVEIVQLYADEARAMRRHDVLLDDYRVANVRINFWDALLFAIMDGLASIAIAMALMWATGGFGGAVTAGVLAAFIDYIGRLFRPIQEFSAKLAVLQRAATSLEKIFGLLAHDERVRSGAVRLGEARGHLRFAGVHFAYGTGPDVLRGVDFEVLPGQVVALVGRTGSGKSSIARLLTRSYDGYRGEITLDGHPIDALDLDDVRRSIGTVRQDVHLLPGTVRFNLTLGIERSDEQLHEAIRVAQADDLVARLGGLDGVLHHRGGNLSVGEAQLLAFARVLVHDPPVVVLDEATASIDTLTEARIDRATTAILARKTVLLIAHRLSTAMNADHIVVLEAGQVVESGPHDDLMAREGRWAAMVRSHFAGEPSHDRAPVVPSRTVPPEVT